MPTFDSAIARKHIEISIKTKQIADATCQDCHTYIATYTTGRSGQSYQRIEQDSGEEFWSIKAWTPAPHRRLKDPDLIITRGQLVKFLVEVKWGTVPGRTDTDLRLGPEERGRMTRLLNVPVMCRVRGPAVRGGHRHRSAEFTITSDYLTDGKTKFVLVADFTAM